VAPPQFKVLEQGQGVYFNTRPHSHPRILGLQVYKLGERVPTAERRCEQQKHYAKLSTDNITIPHTSDSQIGVRLPRGYETGHLRVREKIEYWRKKAHTSTV